MLELLWAMMVSQGKVDVDSKKDMLRIESRRSGFVIRNSVIFGFVIQKF